jgi:hypothetical protein
MPIDGSCSGMRQMLRPLAVAASHSTKHLASALAGTLARVVPGLDDCQGFAGIANCGVRLPGMSVGFVGDWQKHDSN